MKEESQWEIGSDSRGREIYIKLKGTIDRKFSHSFFLVNDAEELAKHILLLVKDLKKLSSGVCAQCNQLISNGDTYYEFKDNKKVHKYCLGEYAEKNVIENILEPRIAEKFDTMEMEYSNFKEDML